MKNLFNKLKIYFKSIKINFNLLLITIGITAATIIVAVISNHINKNKELEIKKKNTELLEDILVNAKIHKDNADSVINIINEYNNKLNQNEKIDWTDLYTSDPDSIAKDVLQWNKSRYNNRR